jgi:hypothetical protein
MQAECKHKKIILFWGEKTVDILGMASIPSITKTTTKLHTNSKQYHYILQLKL